MKCVRMTLSNRSEVRKRVEGTGCDVCGDLTNRRSYEINSVTSLWKRKNIPEERRSPNLTISEILLPSNIIPKKSPGAQRWVNRRPRLRSTKTKNNYHQAKIESITLAKDTSDNESKEDIIESILKTERISLESSVDEYEVDENVMKLIEEANEYDRRSSGSVKDEDVYRKKKKKRKKRRTSDIRSDIAELDSIRIMKQVTLSRPVSPETEQVIRVDVVSSFSVDVNIDSDLSVASSSSSRASNAPPRVTITPKFAQPVQCPDLTVRCQRLRLSARKIDSQKFNYKQTHVKTKQNNNSAKNKSTISNIGSDSNYGY